MDATCSHCGKTYPKTLDHFRNRQRNGREEWDLVCHPCRKLRQKKRDKSASKKRQKALQKVEDAGADLFADSVFRGGATIPHSAEVLEMVMQYFGGVAGFSGMLVKQYFDSPPGGSARNRLIETIVRLVSKNVEMGGAKKPLSLWTEEELDAELQTRFEKALNSFQGVTINGEKEAIQTAPLIPGPVPPEHPVFDAIRTGAVEELARRTGGTPDRGPEALQADAPAGGYPPMQGERSAGDRGESVGQEPL
jgi:hypothetical protein